MKNTIKNILTFVLVLVVIIQFSSDVDAQILDYQNVVTVTLDDGTPVVLYGAAGNEEMLKEVNGLNTYRNVPIMKGDPSKRQRNRGIYGSLGGQKQQIHLGSSIGPIKYGDGFYFTGDYYYLPTNLRLSKRPDGTPEFLFMKYTTENAGEPQGAIMHFLMNWGLTPAQERELQLKLEQKFQLMKKADEKIGKFAKVEKPVVKGAVRLSTEKEGSFEIISATLGDKSTAPVVVHSNRAPTLPGQKVATAAKLDKYGAQLLAATFEKNKSITDVSIECFFKYKVLAPAVKGRITVNWTEMHNRFIKEFEERDVKTEYSHTSRHRFLWWKWSKRHYKHVPTVENINLFTEDLLSSKVVDIQLDNYADPEDPIAKELITSFTSLLVNEISMDNDEFTDEPEGEQEEGITDDMRKKMGNTRLGRHRYRIDVQKIKSKMKKGVQIINLNYRQSVWETVGITGNLGSWYDGVRNNDACVSEVNLNDPFFAHRDINFILDLEAEKMFQEEVNFVTVNVRKRRSEGRDFSDAITIDKNSLSDEGTRVAIDYARGEDNNADEYEYKVQWSLIGNNIYPENPNWKKGDWQGVTLVAPIMPKTIEFEADLEELKEKKIRRASLFVRYQKFGKEHQTVIPLTVSKGKALVEKMIFVDRDQPNYAYKVVVTHEEEGKLADPEWTAEFNDGYVFVTLPELKGSKLQQWLRAAKEFLGSVGSSKNTEIKSPALQILDGIIEAARVVRGG